MVRRFILELCNVCSVQIATVVGVLTISVMNLSLNSVAQITRDAREALPETSTGRWKKPERWCRRHAVLPGTGWQGETCLTNLARVHTCFTDIRFR